MGEQKTNEFFRTTEKEETSTTKYFDFADAVARARSGDRSAQEALYRNSVRLLERVVRKEYDRQEDVEDMLQESYLRIFKNLDQLKDPTRFLSWAAVICKRTVLEYRTRKDKIEPLVDLWPETSEPGEPSLDLLPADEYRKDRNPDAHVDAEALSETVSRILDTLPDTQQMCLLLWMSGYKYQEIADELDVPLGTVKGNMSRAKKKVAETLEEMRKEGTFDYNAVSSDPFRTFLSLLEESLANIEPAPAGDVLATGGKLASLSKKSSTAVLSVLMVLVMAVGLALGIQSRSPEMTAEPATQKTTRVTRTQAEETTASTTAPGGERTANNGAGETPVPAGNPVTVQTPAPAGTNGGANAGRTNATTAVVPQAASGTGGPLTAQVVDISDVPGGDLINGVAGLGSDIADNITIQTPVLDSEILPLNDSDSENIKLYFYVRNHMGQPILFKGYKEASIKSLSGKEILNIRVVVNQPIRMENNDEHWFVFYIPRSQYQFDPLDRVSLERGWFTTTFKEDYTIVE